jgi:hypothetical protein
MQQQRLNYDQKTLACIHPKTITKMRQHSKIVLNLVDSKLNLHQSTPRIPYLCLQL